MEIPRSPLAPARFADTEPVRGVSFYVGATPDTGDERANVMLATLAPGTVVAGVLTQSRCASSPVEWCRKQLVHGKARALLVNSGNANAFAGRRGAEAIDVVVEHLSKSRNIEPEDIFLASTGVIGEPLDPAPILEVLTGMQAGSEAGTEQAAGAIMTTDTYAKGAMAKIDVAGQDVTIVGIAKGSGMIAPDMATMLSFIFTDIAIEPALLQKVLAKQIKTSFNAITVDSDTSTSDTCLVFATGKSNEVRGDPITQKDDVALEAFSNGLHTVLLDLAKQVVRDGEGASKFVQIEISGATSDKSAAIVARSVANSPLVKTAIAGEDANWGRIVMAVGKAGEPADRDRLAIRFGTILVAEMGERASQYDEAETSAYMKNDELMIGIDLGIGTGKAKIYTCDLTHGYISINGDYRS